MCFWAQAQPHEHLYHSLSVEKVTVWCALGRNGILGHTGSRMVMDVRWLWTQSDTLNYCNEKIHPGIETEVRSEHGNIDYQQDGTMPHYSNASLEYLHRYLPGDRLTTSRKDHTRLANLPDLSPLHYFLWGYLKDRIYANISHTIDALKNNIQRSSGDFSMRHCTGLLQTSMWQ